MIENTDIIKNKDLVKTGLKFLKFKYFLVEVKVDSFCFVIKDRIRLRRN